MNTTDESHIDALEFAAFYSQYKVVELLLKAGANVNNRNDEGDTSLLSAVSMHHEYEEYAKEHNSHVKTVNRLIKAGANVNAQNKKGQTALFCAAWWDHVVYKILVKSRS